MVVAERSEIQNQLTDIKLMLRMQGEKMDFIASSARFQTAIRWKKSRTEPKRSAVFPGGGQ